MGKHMRLIGCNWAIYIGRSYLRRAFIIDISWGVPMTEFGPTDCSKYIEIAIDWPRMFYAFPDHEQSFIPDPREISATRWTGRSRRFNGFAWFRHIAWSF